MRPLGQIAPAGGTFTHTAVITGNPPPFGYRWNSNSVLVSFLTTTARTQIITFPAMTGATNAQFRLIVTNAAATGNGVNTLITNVTLADFDQDGLPDAYEVTLGLSTQMELDAVVRKAADKKAKDDVRKGIVEPDGPTLEPASATGVAQEEEVADVADFADEDDAED